jgi:hypothetical protein
MKRRKFIALSTLAGLAAGITSFRFITKSFEEAAADLIRKEVPYLKLDEEGLQKFVSDFSKRKDTRYRFTMRGYSFLGIDSSQSGKVNQLVTAYLLSSDFFSKGMDETRTIKYVGLYDPYLRPCAHPFSHVHYS